MFLENQVQNCVETCNNDCMNMKTILNNFLNLQFKDLTERVDKLEKHVVRIDQKDEEQDERLDRLEQ